MNKLLLQTHEWVRELVENDYFYFQHPVSVRYSASEWPFQAFGICAGPKPGQLYVLDGNGDWHPLTDRESDHKVLEAVHSRVRVMHAAYKAQQKQKEVAP